MDIIGLRELRQRASDVVRRVEGGESVVVTVSGRPAARLSPLPNRRWRTWQQIDAIFDGPAPGGLADEVRSWRRDGEAELVDPFLQPRR